MAKGEVSKQNAEHEMVPKVGITRRAPRGDGVGNERKADMAGAMDGGSRAEAGGMGHTHIGHAVKELERQHPHHHSKGGIHGTTDHHRHEHMVKGKI